MEYARGRLFKDPSLPGMTAEERKVRVESVRRGGGGGGGGVGKGLIQFIFKTNTVERRAEGLAKYVRFNELSLHRRIRYIGVFCINVPL